MHYFIERDTEGAPEWWYSASEGDGSGWRTNIRDATTYGTERNAVIAAHALRRWHKFSFPLTVIPYHISPLPEIGYWKENEGIIVRKRQ